MAYNKTILCIVACSIFFLCSTYAFSQEPETIPPSNVKAVDTPNDDGSSITVTWDAAAEDSSIVGYKILRNTDGGEFEELAGQLDANETKYKDTEITKGKEHAYIVRALTQAEASVDS